MLDKLKVYFNITDESKDNILNIIIENATDLCTTLGFDESLIFSCCVEDYSNYLKSGNSMYTTAQTTDGISKYSDSLQRLLNMTMAARCF